MKTKSLFLAIIIMAAFSLTYYIPRTSAAGLSTLSDSMSRLQKSVDSNHTITFTTPTGVAAGQTMTVAFPSDFSTTGVDNTDIDVSAAGGDLTLAAVANLGTWGAAFGGTGNRTLTITSGTGTITGASIIVIKIGTNASVGSTGDQAINNATAAAGSKMTITAGNGADSGDIGLVVLDSDQINVTAITDPMISLTISDQAIGFSSFVGTNVRYATADAAGSAAGQGAGLPTQLTADTNAGNGLTISVLSEGNGTNAGLWSSGVSELIAADTSRNIIVVGNKKKYAAYGKDATGLTIHENFDNDATDSAITRVAQTFASAAAPVSSGVVDVALVAAADGATKAGSYTDTITIICTGNF